MTKQAKTTLNKKSAIVNLLLLAAVAITIIGFLIDLKNTLTYPGTDLRNRVVGTRLMLEGIDPYFFKWQPKFLETFYDPLDIPTDLSSKLSVPPTVLVLHSLFAPLPYLQQKVVWLLIQWAALIGTTLIFIKTSNCRVKTNLILVTSFLFANSLFWRFHVNSGQIYILYVFLLSIAWLFLKWQSPVHLKTKVPTCGQVLCYEVSLSEGVSFRATEETSATKLRAASDRWSGFNILLSGIFVGITVSLRPSFALFFIPFIVGREYLFILGGILGTTASVGLSLLVAGASIWKKYLFTILIMTRFIDSKAYLPLNEKISPNIIYPKIVEGFNWSIRNPLERYLDNTSLYDVLNALDIPYKHHILVISFVVTMIFLSWCVCQFYFKNKNLNLLFLWGTLTCLIGEFFIPVGRYSYYDIQMMLPLLIIIDIANTQHLICKKNIILLFGLLLSIAGFIVVPRAMFFSVFLIMLYIILISFGLLTDESNLNATKTSDMPQ